MNSAEMSARAGMQENETKQAVREIMISQEIAMHKALNLPMVSTSLCADQWLYERQLLSAAKANGVEVKALIGVENGKPVYLKALANKPAKATLLRANIDDIVMGNFSGFTIPTITTNWSDYCGNPLVKCWGNQGAIYKTPQINAFIRAAMKAVAENRPLYYGMTFNCLGRGITQQTIIDRMGNGYAKNVAAAIVARISTLLCARGIKAHVKQVLRIEYKGGKILANGGRRSEMLTIAYAVNFTPDFPTVNENWIKCPQASKETHVRHGWMVYKPNVQGLRLNTKMTITAYDRKNICAMHDGYKWDAKTWHNFRKGSEKDRPQYSIHQVSAVLARHGKKWSTNKKVLDIG